MKLRSIGSLNLEQAWARARSSARTSGIPDRLPFEVLVRLRNAGYSSSVGTLRNPYAPGSPVVVYAPKESRTLRPFVALSPSDSVLYQALVDQCLPMLVPCLPPADVVFQYRPLVAGKATFDRPKWREFTSHTQAMLAGKYTHVLETDIAGFFLHVRPRRVVESLLAQGAPPEVCGDLDVLLGHFGLHGVEGLPQGHDASSVLSNVALANLDASLAAAGIIYSRWSDDMRFFCTSFREARIVQETVERTLFEDGFTLAAGKTIVRTAASTLKRLENLEESIARIRDEKIREAMEDAGPYDPDQEYVETIHEEAQEAAVAEFYEELIAPIRVGAWSTDPVFHSKIVYALRLLGEHENSAATGDLARLAFRYPDLLVAIADYLRRIAQSRRAPVVAALEALHRDAAYAAEYQRLSVASAAAALAVGGPQPRLASVLAADAADIKANPVLSPDPPKRTS